MAKIREMLQPSLLDRLIDDDPRRQGETLNDRTLTAEDMREIVLRDLDWLLNCGRSQKEIDEFKDFPLAAGSVLNYGVHNLSGMTLSAINEEELAEKMKQTLLHFEPRIYDKTLNVRVSFVAGEMNNRALTFEIEGDLLAQPVPERLLLKYSVDLETGDVSPDDAT